MRWALAVTMLGLMLTSAAPAEVFLRAAPSTPAAGADAQPDPDRPLIPSFQRRGATGAGGPANELNTGDERATANLPGGSILEALTARDLYHGNYCGYGARPGNPEPIDDLDALCRVHDSCWGRAGRKSCACNRALQRGALRLADAARLSRELRTRAALVLEAAGAMECTDP